jgi:pre-mRNA-processing factor 6
MLSLVEISTAHHIFVQEHRQNVRDKCVGAEPHHSPVWQSIAKDVRNTGKSMKEILEMVADTLQ